MTLSYSSEQLNEPLTLATLHRFVTSALSALDLSPGQLEAESRLLIETVTGIHTSLRLISPQMPVNPDHQAKIQALLSERLTHRIPIQYLLGQANFYGLTLDVGPDVLIPRPETELLVHYALEYIAAHYTTLFPTSPKVFEPLRLLDMGTGSGAIAIALKNKLTSQVEVSAVDISPEALTLAKANADRYSAEIQFYQGDWFAALPAKKRFDLILSNPPYIGEDEKALMRPEVLCHEPHLALFPPNNDRALFYRQVAQEAQHWLSPGGTVLMELGQGLEEPVVRLFEQARFSSVQVFSDLAGMPRVLQAKAPDAWPVL